MGPDQNGGPFFVYCAGPVVLQYMAHGDKATVSVKSSALKFNPIHAKLEKTQKTN